MYEHYDDMNAIWKDCLQVLDVAYDHKAVNEGVTGGNICWVSKIWFGPWAANTT